MAEITASQGLFRDTDLYVDDTGGSGRPVVLIHGWPMSADSWSEQVPALQEAGYRVVAYDRRGFGRSGKPATGYGYDSLTKDLDAVVSGLDLDDVTLVGFSMGGGEVARYCGSVGTDRLRSVVFAAAIPPYLAHVPGNPEGPLELTEAAKMAAQLTADQDAFYDGFTTDFFSANGILRVSEEQRQAALALCRQASLPAALACMTSFGTTDFRDDLESVDVPALVLHGDADGIVPLEGSGARTHKAIPSSRLHVIAGGPHGINVSHAAEFTSVLLDFLA